MGKQRNKNACKVRTQKFKATKPHVWSAKVRVFKDDELLSEEVRCSWCWTLRK